MKSYVWVTFAFMGLAFYHLSGGADFEPAAERSPIFAAVEPSVPVAATAVAPVPQVQITDVTAVQSPPVVQVSLRSNATTADPEPRTDASAELAAILTQAVNVPAEVQMQKDLRAVSGSRVNMRQGPGTEFSVIETLAQGTEVEVLEIDATGWARLLVVSTQKEGWMAERLLTSPS